MAVHKTKRENRVSVAELELTPIMNLMVILIPMLLLSIEYLHLVIIESSAPEVSSEVAMDSPQDEKKDEEPKQRLDLTVVMSKKGFTIAASIGVVSNQEATPGEEPGPTIPLTEDGKYNYEKLTEMMLDIREKVDEMATIDDSQKFSIILVPHDELMYEDLIHTMDATRETIVDEKRKWLFPNVAIAGGIL